MRLPLLIFILILLVQFRVIAIKCLRGKTFYYIYAVAEVQEEIIIKLYFR